MGAPGRARNVLMNDEIGRLEQALAAHPRFGGRLTSTFGGRIDCAEEIIAPMKSGKCEIIPPCYGERIFAHTQDHEMAFSFPANRRG